ncbi:unnamed protein product, partial [Timema podura]|nr:unnamed protein product [Timema podura]
VDAKAAALIVAGDQYFQELERGEIEESELEAKAWRTDSTALRRVKDTTFGATSSLFFLFQAQLTSSSEQMALNTGTSNSVTWLAKSSGNTRNGSNTTRKMGTKQRGTLRPINDFVVYDERLKSLIKNIKAVRGAECETDHFMVISVNELVYIRAETITFEQKQVQIKELQYDTTTDTLLLRLPTSGYDFTVAYQANIR